MPRRTGRIRQAIDKVGTAAKAYEILAGEVSDLLDKLEDEGLTITVESLGGFAIPKTTFRIRIGDEDVEDEEKPEDVS